jgi:hypothetical protein
MVEGREVHALIFEIPNREHRGGISLGHTCARGVTREWMTMTRPRGQHIEKMVI